MSPFFTPVAQTGESTRLIIGRPRVRSSPGVLIFNMRNLIIMREMTEEEIKELKKYSNMLGQIAGHVEEFCSEDTTTLQGVMLMKAELYELRAQALRDTVDSSWLKRDK